MKKTLLLLTLCAPLWLAGCNESTENVSSIETVEDESYASRPTAAAPGVKSLDVAQETSVESSQERLVAETQTWRFDIKASELPKTWERHSQLCQSQLFQGQCDIARAQISERTIGSETTSGQLNLQVARPVFDNFIKRLGEDAPPPVSITVERDDKTLEWADLSARKQSAEQLRDRLVSMLNDSGTTRTLADLIALERELNRVQSNLDAMQARARVMQNETQKIRLILNYRSAAPRGVNNLLYPITSAWKHMAKTFFGSVGDVMLFVAMTLPWIVVLIPGWFGLRKLWRFITRRRRQGNPA